MFGCLAVVNSVFVCSDFVCLFLFNFVRNDFSKGAFWVNQNLVSSSQIAGISTTSTRTLTPLAKNILRVRKS